MSFYTYIVASRRNGTLYTGSTDDIGKRLGEHRDKVRPGFTAKHGVAILVWFEVHETQRSCVQARAPDQGMEAELEAGDDRARQSGLG